MTYYYLNKQYPDFSTTPTVVKMLNYNLKADQLAQGFASIPQLSPTWKAKQLMTSFKEPEIDHLSLEDQKSVSMEHTRKCLE